KSEGNRRRDCMENLLGVRDHLGAVDITVPGGDPSRQRTEALLFQGAGTFLPRLRSHGRARSGSAEGESDGQDRAKLPSDSRELGRAALRQGATRLSDGLRA